MSELRFDNRVVIVTGGAGALGRAYCELFASRGASVVINDLPARESGKESNAEKLAKQINTQATKTKGWGKAIANHDSVDQGERIVDATIKAFGRVDVIVNNAGILEDASFLKMTQQQWERIMRIHLDGAYKVTKAAWPYMIKQKYGRVIMTTSAAGLYGNFGQANYSAAKLALVGLAFTLGREGAKNNIFVNAIAPIAGSPMTETILPSEIVQALKPQYVAPVVVSLCHESSTANRQVFEVGGGWVSEVRWQRSQGHLFPLTEKALTPESVMMKWSGISDFNNKVDYPNDPQSSFGVILEHLDNNKAALEAEAKKQEEANKSNNNNKNNNTENKSSIESDFESAHVFTALKDMITPDLVKKVKGVFAFELTSKSGKVATWVVDLKNGTGAMYTPTQIAAGGVKVPKPDVTLILSDDVFISMVNKKSQPQQLFTTGKLKIKGNLPLALKFQMVTKPLEDMALSKL